MEFCRSDGECLRCCPSHTQQPWEGNPGVSTKSEGKSRLFYILEHWVIPGNLGEWEVSLPVARWAWLILKAHPAQTIP